jgi:catechol 2,3-dioxygenase-like lactoylglutathione lyase family enzyme
MPGSTPEPVARTRITPGNSDLCFVWDGPIDGAVAHLRSHGVNVELGPVARTGAGGDGMSVYFRDPDGSLLELISYTTS